MVAELEPIDLAGRETISTEIARRLLTYFLAGSIKPGDRIPSERKLAEALGVGRSVVREALKSLALLGLIEVRQGNGTFLKRADSDLLPEAIEWGLLLGEKRVKDLIEARRHLEVLLAGLAAERRTESDIEALKTELRRMEKAGRNSERVIEADVEFHVHVWSAAGNAVLQQTLTSIRSLLQVWIRRVYRAETDSRRTVSEHVPIFEAIKRGDPEAARTAMAAHMASAAARLEATIPEGEASSTVSATAKPMAKP
jgi:GntR family transcriptional repressor for pyruvate dehydrogenase complex